MSWELAVVIAGGLASILHLLAAGTGLRDEGFLSNPGTACWSWVLSTTWRGSRPASDVGASPPEEIANKLLLERLFAGAGSTLVILLWTGQCFLVSVIVNSVLGNRRWMSPIMDMILIVCLVGFSIAKLFPSSFRQTTQNMWYSFFMVQLCVAASPVGAAEDISLTAQMITVMRILASPLSARVSYVIVWNVLCTLMMVSTFFLRGRQLAINHAITECCVCLIIIFPRIREQAQMAGAARCEIEALDAKLDCAAVISLLKAMSDAVVKLNKDLKIEEHSCQFAGLLLNGSRCLAGAAFEQFLASDKERERFAKHMEKKPDAAQSIAEVFHLLLHDSMRNLVNVEVFHFCFAKTGNRLQHVLGIREVVEAEQRRAVALHDGPAVENPRATAGDNAPPLTDEVQRQPQDLWPTEPAGLIFDMDSMNIKECSQPMLRMLGIAHTSSVIGTPLETWFPESLNSDFVTGYAAMVEKFRDRDLPVVSKTFRVVMQVKESESSSVSKRLDAKFDMKVTIRRTCPNSEQQTSHDASAILKDSRPWGLVRDGSQLPRHGRSQSRSSCSSSSRSSRSCCRREGDEGGIVQRFDLITHEPEGVHQAPLHFDL